MLDYTKAAFKKTIEDFKKIDFIRNVATQILYIGYLVYALIANVGVWAANVVLLCLSLSYFIFFLVVTVKSVKKGVKKRVKIAFTRCKQVIRFYTLGVMIYGICATTKHVTALSLVLSALMIVAWILQILFEVIFKFFIGRAQFIIEGMEADYENITKPVRTVGNFFKKMTGKEVEEEKEPTKNRQVLDGLVLQAKAEKEEKKIAEKALRKERKSELRQAKKQAKADKKAARRTPATALSEEIALSDDE